jgi:Tsi6
MTPQSIQNVLQAIARAGAMTESRLAGFPGYGVYIHAKEQIDQMRSILGSGRLPTAEEKGQIDIGLMAVRELEVEEPEYAEALIYLAARFSEL